MSLGPISEKWAALVNQKVLVSDSAQLRAVALVDQFYDKVHKHRASMQHQQLSQFDISPFRADDRKEANYHEDVAEYTKRLAIENKRLLAKQSGSPFPSQPPLPQVEPKTSDTVQAAQTVTAAPQPKGTHIYLFGSVGRGKTLLMDILFRSLTEEGIKGRVKRVHFFELMKDVHSKLASADITTIANQIADETDTLLIDEVALTDVQDASIFPSVLQVLLKRQVALVMTSNQHPQRLYSGGLNRHIFLPPLLRLLRESGCELVSLNDEVGTDEVGTDYRSTSGGIKRDWSWVPLRPASAPALPTETTIQLSPTRTLSLPQDEDCLIMDSAALLDVGENDFLVLSEFLNKNGIALRLIVREPFQAIDILSSARRFCKLIEVLYDQRCRVIVASDLTPEALFHAVTGREELESKGIVGESGDALASSLAASAVDEAIRAIQRCTSRLTEAVRLS